MEIPTKRTVRFKPKPKKFNSEGILKAIHASRSDCVTPHDNSFKSNDTTTTTTTMRTLDIKEALEAAKPKLDKKILQRKITTEEIRLAEIATQRKLQRESVEKVQKVYDFDENLSSVRDYLKVTNCPRTWLYTTNIHDIQDETSCNNYLDYKDQFS